MLSYGKMEKQMQKVKMQRCKKEKATVEKARESNWRLK